LITLVISADVSRRYSFNVAYMEVYGVTVRTGDPEVEETANKVVSELTSKYSLFTLAGDPIAKAYRSFYWRLGIDPTKKRASGEALVRRVLRSNTFPLVNNVVDCGNFASAETLVPIGIYDLDKVAGDALVFRFAKPGELFMPIGGPPERLFPRNIVLTDGNVVLHVYPHRDSELTKVTSETENVLCIACGAPGIEAELLTGALEKLKSYLERFSGFRRATPIRIV
jgi:DNA/RNA-binding domain of Phe-tRNA-synthetase-like protein